MKLSRSLLYVLISIFVIGITLICLVPTTSILSRIATGLITGSFVGAINTLVNYFHQRKQYFEEYSLFALNMSHELLTDFSRHKVRMEHIQTLRREDIIEQDHKCTMEHLEEARKFGEKYQDFRMKMDFSPYAPLFGLNSKRTKLLEDLYDVVWHIETLSIELQSVYAFGMLAVKCSKEEQMLAIGDPDEFYDYVMQDNIDYRDMLVFYSNQLALLSEKLQDNLKGVVDKLYITIWESVAGRLKDMIKDYEIRDVMAEKERELEQDMDEEESGFAEVEE